MTGLSLTNFWSEFSATDSPVGCLWCQDGRIRLTLYIQWQVRLQGPGMGVASLTVDESRFHVIL